MDEFSLRASDGADIACYCWRPTTTPRAVVLIAHGMGEHAKRYDWVAQQLTAAGYAVYANDHRGHGETAADGPGYLGGDGWNRVLADAYEINRHVAKAYPEVPRVLLGHSMGALLAQQYVTRHPATIDALALSGSGGFRRRSLIASALLWIEHKRLAADATSSVMQGALFGNANKPFDGPDATGFEWLSRDAEQVQAYIDDPACGGVLAIGSLAEFFEGGRAAQEPASVARIPNQLPIYIFSGTDDPVHQEQTGINRMIDAYRNAGAERLEYRFYAGGRHEMFNETNRDEVVADLLAWLGRST